jgi:hypothetical protein
MFYLCDKKGNSHDLEARTLKIRKIKTPSLPDNLKDNYETIQMLTTLSDVSFLG